MRVFESNPEKQLNERFERNLTAYIAAASAAGVGLFAAAQPAHAKIVYTSANLAIPINGTLVPIDINHDGVPDFSFYGVSYFGSARTRLGLYQEFLQVSPSKAPNEVWTVISQGDQCAAALPAGVEVGPNPAFKVNPAVMWQVAGDYTNQFSAKCPWRDKHHGAFLGLKFLINGQIHYGWAHVTGTTLNGYAYETVPNKAISTGATSGPDKFVSQDLLDSSFPPPASLGLLARGAEGLQAWRRRDNGAQI